MKNLLSIYLLVLMALPTFAESQKPHSDRVISFEQATEEAMQEASFITEIKILCSRSVQEKAKEFTHQMTKSVAAVAASLPNANPNEVDKTINEFRQKYENAFSCEATIIEALDNGISEAQVINALDEII